MGTRETLLQLGTPRVVVPSLRAGGSLVSRLHREANPALSGHVDGVLVARVGVPKDAHRGVRRQDPLELLRGKIRAVGDVY